MDVLQHVEAKAEYQQSCIHRFLSEVEKSVKIRYGVEEIQKDDSPHWPATGPKTSTRKHIENTAAK